VLVFGGDGEYGLWPLVSHVLLPTKLTVTPFVFVLSHAVRRARATSSISGRRRTGAL
jgi:hypothetical protein